MRVGLAAAVACLVAFVGTAQAADRPDVERPAVMAVVTRAAALELSLAEREVASLQRRVRKLEKRVDRLQTAKQKRAERRRCELPSDVVILGRCLQQKGFRVSEHPAFGGVDPVHASGSQHYSPCSCALDVNADSNEAARLDGLAAWLRGVPGVDQLLWRVPGHFDHLHVSMP